MSKQASEVLGVADHEMLTQCTTIAHQGVAILDSEDPGSKKLLEAFLSTSRMKGWFDVAIHGSEENELFSFFNIRSPHPQKSGETVRFMVFPEELAKVIRQSGYRPGSPIRLFACHAACLDKDKIPLAKSLARLLNTEVLASNKSNKNHAGTGFLAMPPKFEPGPTEYTLFHPTDNPNLHRLKMSKTAEEIAHGTANKTWHW